MPKSETAKKVAAKKSTAKKDMSALDFETTMRQLEQIVIRLESGDLSLEKALDAFERGVNLAQMGQDTLKRAEQRVQILLDNDKNSDLLPFSPSSSSE